MRRFAIAAILFASPVFLASPIALQSAYAVPGGEITIEDTSHIARASTAVDDYGKVEFALTDGTGAAAEGVPVTLTNTVTGEVLTATSFNGAAVFESVTPGVWTVATSAPGITFSNIAISTMTAVAAGGAAGVSAAGLGLAAVGVGGSAAVAIGASEASKSNDEDNNDDPAPTPTPRPTAPNATPTPVVTFRPTSTPLPPIPTLEPTPVDISPSR